MIIAATDAVTITFIGGIQAIILAIIGVYAQRVRRDTRHIRSETETNGGSSLSDRVTHVVDMVHAINRRVRAGERLHSSQHHQNVERLKRIEDQLGIEDDATGIDASTTDDHDYE